MDLYTLLSSRLVGLRRNPDQSWQAQCPACAAEGADSTRSHLRIYRGGAFNCAKAGPDNRDHNKAIRAVLYQYADPDLLAELSLQIIDPEPKLEVEKVYPEEMLARLTPDYRYWVGRGISEEVLRRVEGGLAPQDERSKLSGRFVHPIRDEKRRIVGWNGRLVSEASFGPRWKHLCRVSKVVYPIHVSGDAIRATRKVVLLESPGDFMSCATVGIWNAIVLLGLNLNACILGYLVSVNPTHIIISTNNDQVGLDPAKSRDAGNKAADKLRAKLVPFFGEERVVVNLPPRKDWNVVLQECPDELRAFKAELEAL